MVWPVTGGFVIYLTYGPQVDWLRNLQAAGQGSLVWHHREYFFKEPESIDAKTALPALPSLMRAVLRRVARDFVLLPTESLC